MIRILYIEDDPLDADLARRSLMKNEQGYSLEILPTLAEARARLAEEPTPDLVLVDLRLPDGDAFDLLSDLQKDPEAPGVIVITGRGDEETVVAVLKAGADDYVVKSATSIERLPITLENVMRRRHTFRGSRLRRLRVLYAESNPLDADLTRRHMAANAAHIELVNVPSAEDVLDLYAGEPVQQPFDVLLLDFRLPGMNALELIKELREGFRVETPIVMVTGHGSQDIAMQAIRLGAADYLVKNSGYLFQLPSVLENAYHHHQFDLERQALQESEERFRRLAENAQDIIYRFRLLPVPGFEYVSPSVTRITGYTPEEHYADPELGINRVHPDDHSLLETQFQTDRDFQKPVLLRWVRKDGALIWTEQHYAPIYNDAGVLVAVEGIARDVTERVRTEERIRLHLERMSALRTIDITISASLNLRTTLEVLLENVVHHLEVDAADILLLNQGLHSLEYAAGRGFRLQVADRPAQPIAKGYAWKCISERQIVQAQGPEFADATRNFVEFLNVEGVVLYVCAPLVAKGRAIGVLEVFLRTPRSPDQEWLDFLESLAGQASIAVDMAELFEDLQRSNMELRLAYETTLEGWVRTLDLRDKETEGHTVRVAEVAVDLARHLNISDEDLIHIRRGALLHDIGKMGIPDEILNKPGPLTQKEWVIMRRHPEYAYELLYPITYLRRALEIPYNHHERWDGSGYPRGLREEEIPFSARIFSVVDVWDALISNRPYRKAWSKEEARRYLKEQAGMQFDPRIVEQFLQLVNG